jgi:hypothetical protein
MMLPALPRLAGLSRLWGAGPAVRRKLQEIFGLDLRSLALLRVGLALLLIGDLLYRSTDLVAHYTDDGLLPRSALPVTGPASIHVLHGAPWFEGVLFVVAGLFAVALLLGLYTRFVSVVSWFLLISLHARNPMILQGGDIFFRVVLFWASFLPLGARFSLDSLRRRTPAREGNLLVSPATVALLLQICFLYWFASALKTDPVWRHDGTAIYYALNIDQIVTRLGRSLLAFPRLLTFLTFTTVVMEALGPVLLFCPVFTGPVRVAAVTGFALFHLVGLNLCMDLGIFPYICAVAWLSLLPGWFWDRLACRARAPAPLGRLLAVGAAVAGRLAALCPRRAGEDDRAVGRLTWLQSTAVIFLLAYVFFWNLRTVNYPKYARYFPPQVNPIGCTLGLDQMWNMFAPFPLKEDGWWVIQGELKDGSRVDVWKGGAPVCWQKPDLVSETYKNERWRKYMLNLWYTINAAHRPLFAQYLCRQWNARHPDRPLRSLEVYYMLRTTLPDYRQSTPERVLVYVHPATAVATAAH